MSEAKFTPGPWRISQGNIGNAIEAQSGKKSYEFDNGFRILATFQHCEPTGKYLEEQENAKANAHLIAAAPELYEALIDMFNGWQYIRQSHGDLYGVGWDRAEEKARAALAKARGETND